MRTRSAVVFVVGMLVGATAGTGPLASSAGANAVPRTATLADGTRFHENGNATEYISWFGASLPMSAGDARAYSAEGNKAVSTVAAGYVSAHPASDFPAHRAIRIVGSLSEYVDDGQELLPLRVEDSASCLSNLGQAHIAVVPEQWSRPIAIGPNTTCTKAQSLGGPFSLVQTYSPPTSPFGRLPLTAQPAESVGIVEIFFGGGLAGDFNGDGKADQLIYGSGSAPDEIWYGTTNGFKLGPAISVNGEYGPVISDFNGDGRDDVLWYGTGATGSAAPSPSSLWLGRSGTAGFLHGPAIPTPPQSTATLTGTGSIEETLYLPRVGDFNGDGKSDVYWAVYVTTQPKLPPNVVWYGKVNGFTVGTKSTAPITEPIVGGTSQRGQQLQSRIARINALTRRLNPLATAITLPEIRLVAQPEIADYNGDDHDDLLWYAAGRTRLWHGAAPAEGFTNATVVTVYGEYLPAVGDFDGDGNADVLWYAAGATADTLWLGGTHGFTNGPAVTVNGEYIPVVGNFNGDGKQDIFWWGLDGHDYTWFGRTSGFNAAPETVEADLGTNFEIPTVGDFNGDGHDDLLWLRIHFDFTGDNLDIAITQPLWHAH